MASTSTVAIVETDRDELRRRIAVARERFFHLARTADPDAHGPRCAWSVQELVAHVLTVAHRYQAVIEGRDYRRAGTPRDLDAINQEELDDVLAPVGQMVDRIEALGPLMDGYFDAHTSGHQDIDFHCGITASSIMAQTNWLSELLLHGEDIALALGAPWKLDERDMVLVLRGALEAAPAYLRADVPDDAALSVALKVPDAQPFQLVIHDGVCEVRDRTPGDRPDAVLRAPASTVVSMIFGRIGVLTAARRGALVVGGRRPWRAIKMQSYFEIA